MTTEYDSLLSSNSSTMINCYSSCYYDEPLCDVVSEEVTSARVISEPNRNEVKRRKMRKAVVAAEVTGLCLSAAVLGVPGVVIVGGGILAAEIARKKYKERKMMTSSI